MIIVQPDYEDVETGTITLELSQKVAADHRENVARLVAAYKAAKSE